jgi:hypothetical protein
MLNKSKRENENCKGSLCKLFKFIWFLLKGVRRGDEKQTSYDQIIPFTYLDRNFIGLIITSLVVLPSRRVGLFVLSLFPVHLPQDIWVPVFFSVFFTYKLESPHLIAGGTLRLIRKRQGSGSRGYMLLLTLTFITFKYMENHG